MTYAVCYLHIKQIAISQERRAIWKNYRWSSFIISRVLSNKTNLIFISCKLENVIITTLHSPTHTPDSFLWIYPVNLETPRQYMLRQCICECDGEEAACQNLVECQFSWNNYWNIVFFGYLTNVFLFLLQFLATTWGFAEDFVTATGKQECTSLR